jgi:predicted ATP-binding protein involved in virulence/plasmid maintenance system antidote protein VapI
MNHPDDTWYRLLDWNYGSESANYLAKQVLLDQGFTFLDAVHPLGGADVGNNSLLAKDGQRWLMVVYFPRQQQSFETIKTQFTDALAAIAKYAANGIVFVTNQELSRSERIELKQLCDFSLLEVFHLERLATILDSPHMAKVRQQTLYIETIPVKLPADLADHTTALETNPQQIVKLEKLALQDFAAHGANLAENLNDLSVKLHGQGQRAAALAAGHRAVTIFEHLVEQSIGTNEAGLTKSLKNLSSYLLNMGEGEAALTASQRAVEIAERLAQQDFAAHAANLASTLDNLSTHLAFHGKKVPALAALQRAVTILENLAQQDFAQHGPDLAQSLSNLSARLGELDNFIEALSASHKAVSIFENLAQQNFSTYGNSLGTSLNNLALCLKMQGNYIAALIAGKRAVTIFESLAQQDFASNAPELAMGFHNLASYYAFADERSNALAAIQKAVTLYEGLAQQNPAQYKAKLADSLFVLFKFTNGPNDARILERAINLLEPYIQAGTTHCEWYEAAPAFWRQKIQGSTNIIQLNNVSLKNYRGFAQIDINFEPDITVLVANNGQGKTTVLDACKIALWTYLSGFDLARTANDTQFDIKLDDVHFHKISTVNWARQLPAAISVNGNYGPYTAATWTQFLDSEIQGSPTKDDDGAASLKAWTRLLQSQVRNAQLPPLDLPVFAYYDTDRSWAQQRLRTGTDDTKYADTGNDFYIRTVAYRECLTPAPSYATFEEWFEWIFISHRETQIKNKESGLAEDSPSAWWDTIQVVQQAINSLLKKHTGWHSLEFSVSQKSLILSNDQQLTLKVSQLSDGIRNMLGMIGDLAFRCIKINPHLGKQAALEAHGVVLIDEIDMHLHPRWQQHVVGQLREAFPKIQFIVTTHSHQVLSSVFARSIRVLRQQTDSEGSHYVVEPIQFETRGVASSVVLARIMGIDEVPDVPESTELRKYRGLIQQGLHESDEGKILAAKLNAHFGENHPEIIECARMIRLEGVKRKVELARAEKATHSSAGANNA